MKKLLGIGGLVIVLIAVALIARAVFWAHSEDAMIRIAVPKPGATVSSPLTVTGQARGNWFFEATFPVVLTDWDGRIIAQTQARAQGDWMTTEFVPFTATLTFQNPTASNGADYAKRGFLIFKKDNPSGLPANDDSREIQVLFK
jgi:hypothetical protein